MAKYVVFKSGQVRLRNGRWKYEANTKFRLSAESSQFYFIGNDRLEKSRENIDYVIGDMEVVY